MGFQQILVAVEDAEFGQVAIDFAQKIAAPGARIHLLNVAARATVQVLQAPFEVPANALPEDASPSAADVMSETHTITHSEELMKTLSGQLATNGYDVSTEVEFGAVVDTIIEIASSGYEVIVMTTHGRAGLARLVAGSVAEGVLHKAPCPVLLIPVNTLQAE